MDASTTSLPLAADPKQPAAYAQPRLQRWGSLLTQGGADFKNEPATKQHTRF